LQSLPMAVLAAACAVLPSTNEEKFLLSRAATANNKKVDDYWTGFCQC
jgi:hypothetical protein